MLERGALDLAFFETAETGPGQTVLRRERTCWMMSRHHDLLLRDPVPVALFDRQCWWRDAALAALEHAGQPYRVVFSSQSVAGVAAAIEAGVAIGLLGEAGADPRLQRLGPEHGFGEMPVSTLVMARRPGADDASAEAMAQAIRSAFEFASD